MARGGAPLCSEVSVSVAVCVRVGSVRVRMGGTAFDFLIFDFLIFHF